MRKLITFILLGALLALNIAAKSEIKFKEKLIDFGEIESGEIVKLTFEFENVGDSLLIIKNITATCGCTVPRLKKREFEPGEKGEIPVQFLSRGYSGKVTKSLKVTTNNPDRVFDRLTITGTVKLTNFAAIEMTPDQIDFKKVKLAGTYKKKVEIKNTGTIDLRIVEVIHNPEIYPVFEKNTLKPGEKTDVTIVFKAMQVGRFSTFLKIRSNAYRQRLVVLHLNAEIE
jgi:hypothetical protein